MKKFLQKNIFLLLILSFSLIKGILWMGLIPALQAPDEERHFSTIIWYADKNNAVSRVYSGTVTDWYDINTYLIPQSYKNFLLNSQFGNTRFNINSHQTFANRQSNGIGETDFKNQKANEHFQNTPPTIVNYPPLYYFLASKIYSLTTSFDFYTRLTITEFFSLLVFLGVIILVYLNAKAWNLTEKKSAMLAAIISLQPMLTFSGIMINVDILLIFFFSLFFLVAYTVLENGWKWQNVLLIAFSIIGAIFTKPPGYILIVLFSLLVLMTLKINKKQVCISLPIFSTIILLPLIIYHSKLASLFSSLITYSKLHFDPIKQYYLFGTYWGRFGWLDYPLQTYIFLIIAFVVLAGYIGFIISLFKKDAAYRKKGLFSLTSVLLFHFAIVGYEFVYFQSTGQEYGLQGRYFLPTIIPSLFMVVFGILFVCKKMNKEIILAIILFLMLLLNNYALFSIIIPSYYL